MIRCAVNQQRRSDAGRRNGDHCLPLSLQYGDESVVQERLPRSSRAIQEILMRNCIFSIVDGSHDLIEGSPLTFTLVVLDLTHSLGYLQRELSRPRGCPFGGPTPAGSSRGGDILGFG
ncbi:hypothetical protein DAPPUDRAFT_257479 [Daphnia pulex]|uniref:Uncharacterized protein n=1 Tax=Daphnia pulex TaxID=6669 RepID=E9HDN2_DAPPU|nr:hypothetical protein DAPPUDRAFT_257479 [Daphnia pulex]|eukprot:EFX70178.1 hypothetical protein DAPPUDRAFT_257479 [Daphnia pulex]